MHNRRQEEDYKYFRTTCGLVGFIVFFLVAFLSFIVAEETGIYYEYAIIFGFVMLFATALFFCCIMHESKRVYTTHTQPSDWLPLNTLEPEQPEENEPQPEVEVPSEPEQPPLPDGEATDDLNNLLKFLALSSEGTSEAATSKELQRKVSTLSKEDATNIQLDSAGAGCSKTACEGPETLESGSNASDTSGITTTAAQKATKKALVAFSDLSLEDFDDLADKVTKPTPSFTYCEDLLYIDDDPENTESTEKTIDVSSFKKEPKKLE